MYFCAIKIFTNYRSLVERDGVSFLMRIFSVIGNFVSSFPFFLSQEIGILIRYQSLPELLR